MELPKPVIFISSVSSELRTVRKLVADNLKIIGFDPKWQDTESTGHGDILEVLRNWIDLSTAVVQIVGHCFGYAAGKPDPDFSFCSLTQYEALYAEKTGKPVYYIVLDPLHPVDSTGKESVRHRKLQQAYRKSLKPDNKLYQKSSSSLETENIILRMPDRRAELRKESMELEQRRDEALAAALRALPIEVAQELQRTILGQSWQLSESRAYATLEKSLHLPIGTLAKELPSFAADFSSRKGTLDLDRASALYATKHFAEAEQQALIAVERIFHNSSKQFAPVINALEIAGSAATEQNDLPRAVDHFKRAISFIDPHADFHNWARIQNEIGRILYRMGRYKEQTMVMEEACKRCGIEGEMNSSVGVRCRTTWALALNFSGHSEQAEAEFRKILEISKSLYGLDSSETLYCQGNLGVALYFQDKFSEAEQLIAPVLKFSREKLGEKAPDTLKHRGNLALAVNGQGRHSEAEIEFQKILDLETEVFGPKDRKTLMTRNNLADSLNCQKKFPEAEKEHRAILKLKQDTLRPNHPSIFTSYYNLADCLGAQNKKGALKFARIALKGWESELPHDHRDVKDAQKLVERLKTNPVD